MCGIHVSISSVWRALQQSGYTMKKVWYVSNSIDGVPCSSQSWQLSTVQKCMLHTYIKLVFATGHISLYLLMRVHVLLYILL